MIIHSPLQDRCTNRTRDNVLVVCNVLWHQVYKLREVTQLLSHLPHTNNITQHPNLWKMSLSTLVHTTPGSDTHTHHSTQTTTVRKLILRNVRCLRLFKIICTAMHTLTHTHTYTTTPAMISTTQVPELTSNFPALPVTPPTAIVWYWVTVYYTSKSIIL